MEIFGICDLRERSGELSRLAEAGQLAIPLVDYQPDDLEQELNNPG